ncbi:MAG: hypothetical protein NVS3B19_09930 [Ginsengibacter sp.]
MEIKFLLWKHFVIHFSQPVQLGLLICVLIICWNIENVYGLTLNYKKWKHASINAPFGIFSIPVQVFLGFLFLKTIQWTSIHHFGITYLFYSLQTNQIALFIFTFLLLDLGEYIYHVIMHKVKSFWMFHLVHHSDTVVDTSTTFREHPGETFIRLSFTLLWIFLSGSLLWVLVIRQLIQVITTLFAHVNYMLPEKMNNLLSLIFITPNLHHIHHHFQQPYTDSNYGDVLSIWDRIFGTFQNETNDTIKYGVDNYLEEKDTGNFKNVFFIPFGKYRTNK